jgi:diguanylate cyclase (GGDEF)-like protein
LALTYNAIINLYSIVLLAVILFYSLKHTESVDHLQHKLFLLMIQINIVMLFIDVLSRFDGNPGTFYEVFNYLGNLLIYVFNPVLPAIWLLYAHYQIYRDESRTRRLLMPILTFVMVYYTFYAVSQFYHWFYYIDSGNVYHRGEYFWIAAAIPVIFILITFVMITVNRHLIEKRYYRALIFFVVPPFVGIILQIIFINFAFVLNGITISLFIVFLYIQNQNQNLDFLTGVYNRKRLKTYLKEKIACCSYNKTFSAIFIDIDNFKYINDTFGHDMGDDALETCAMLLKNCIRATDFIARFGGDEFYLVLDVSSRSELERTVHRIYRQLQEFNGENRKPYHISVSMGYAVYDYASELSAEEFQKMIDNLMYQDKRITKGEKYV